MPRTLVVLTALVAMGLTGLGTATAARTLFTSKDIKDGSLYSRDLNPGLRQAILSKGKTGTPVTAQSTGPAGSQGAAGATGQQGPEGDQGPAGPQGAQGPAGADGASGEGTPVGPLFGNVGDDQPFRSEDYQCYEEGDPSGSGAFINGVGAGNPTPPLGTGAYATVGGDPDEGHALRYTGIDGVKMADVETLRISTFFTGGSPTDAQYIQLNLDTDNDGDRDAVLSFEPAYQTGTYPEGDGTKAPDQGALQKDTWQTWDVRESALREIRGLDGDTPEQDDEPEDLWDAYVTANPEARFKASEGAVTGAFNIVAGCGGQTNSSDYETMTDSVVIKLAGEKTRLFDLGN